MTALMKFGRLISFALCMMLVSVLYIAFGVQQVEASRHDILGLWRGDINNAQGLGEATLDVFMEGNAITAIRSNYNLPGRTNQVTPFVVRKNVTHDPATGLFEMRFTNWVHQGPGARSPGGFRGSISDCGNIFSGHWIGHDHLMFRFVRQTAPVMQRSINLTASPTNGGRANGGGTIRLGDEVMLTATPNSGWDFVGWYEVGVRMNSDPEWRFIVDSDRRLEARFAEQPLVQPEPPIQALPPVTPVPPVETPPLHPSYITIRGVQFSTSATEVDLSGDFRGERNNGHFRDLANWEIYPLRYMTNLRHLSLDEQMIINLSPLSNLTNLERLSLNRTSVSDLTPLSNLTNLKELSLDFAPVRDLTPLSTLTNLRALSLTSTPINNIAPLAHLINLESLFLNNSLFYGGLEGFQFISDLTPLSNLVNLTTLDLSLNVNMTRLEGPHHLDITPLGNLTNLEWLDLSANNLHDISPLGNLSNLRLLLLSFNQISDVSPLGSLYSLEWLFLSNNPIIDISPLSNLDLKWLGLGFTHVGDVAPLRSMISLEWLLMNGIPLHPNSISDISPLSNLVNLEWLVLPYHHLINDFTPIAHLPNFETWYHLGFGQPFPQLLQHIIGNEFRGLILMHSSKPLHTPAPPIAPLPPVAPVPPIAPLPPTTPEQPIFTWICLTDTTFTVSNRSGGAGWNARDVRARDSWVLTYTASRGAVYSLHQLNGRYTELETTIFPAAFWFHDHSSPNPWHNGRFRFYADGVLMRDIEFNVLRDIQTYYWGSTSNVQVHLDVTGVWQLKISFHNSSAQVANTWATYALMGTFR